MQLYFLRHAIAHDADENTPDEQRALTDKGIAHTRPRRAADQSARRQAEPPVFQPAGARPRNGEYCGAGARH